MLNVYKYATNLANLKSDTQTGDYTIKQLQQAWGQTVVERKYRC